MPGDLLALDLTAEDNGTHMCCSSDVMNSPLVPRCEACGFRTDFEFVDTDYRLKKEAPDFSFTYDGYCIVSERARRVLSRCEVPPEFVALPASRGYFVLFPRSVVSIDPRFLRFEERCAGCGEYASVTGLVALPEGVERPLPRGVYRSDIKLGSHNAKWCIKIVSVDLAEEVQATGLTGAIFEELRALDAAERDALEQQVRSWDSHFEEVLRRLRSKPWWRFW